MFSLKNSIFKHLIRVFCLNISLLAMHTTAHADLKTGNELNTHSDHLEQIDHSKHQAIMKSTKVSKSLVTYRIPDLALINKAGEKVSVVEELSPDKPILLNFIFTTCTTVCPVMSATFAQTQKLLGTDVDKVKMVSISIDPEQDSPEKLRAYAKKFKASKHWHFLTGNVDDIMTVLQAFDVYRGNKMSHEPVTFLRKTKTDPWVRLDGLTTAKELVIEYQNLIKS